MNVEIDLVDKRIFKDRWKAIFYDLSLLNFGGKPYKSSAIILGNILFIAFLIAEKPPLYFIPIFPALFISLFPFVAAAITYNSKLYINDNSFAVKCGRLKYQSGSISDLIEIHFLKGRFNGIYRVRVRGLGEASGFVLHHKIIPPPLNYLKVIEKEF